jgi:hypothetical protein
MLTQVWLPAASTGIATTAVEARDTDRFDILPLPLFAMVKDRMALFPPALTVRFADSNLMMPQV